MQAAIGAGFPSAMTLLGPCCCGTTIGEFSVEVLGLIHIPREGPIRQIFHSPALVQSLLQRAEGMERMKDLSALISQTESGLLFQPGFSPFRFNLQLLLNRQISLGKEGIYLFGYYYFF